MTARSIYALVHQDFRAVLIPLTGSILILCVIIGISVRTSYGPFDLEAPLWFLFGMILGAGIFARDRRTGIAPTLHSLPVSDLSRSMVRLVFRALLIVLTIAVFIKLKQQFDLYYWSSGRDWTSPDIALRKLLHFYDNVPGMIGTGLLAALAGFLPTTAFSAVVRRETTAFGAAFLMLLTGFILLAVILALHPFWSLLTASVIHFQWIWVVLLGAGSIIAGIHGITLRDPEPRPALVRIIRPMAITLVFGAVLFAATPYYLFMRAPSLISKISFRAAIPGSTDVLVSTRAGHENRSFGLGLWRMGSSRMNRLIGNDVVNNMSISPDGRYIAASIPWRHMWDYWRMTLEIRDISGHLIRRETGTFINFTGQWSPDGRWFAFPAMEMKKSGILFIPASADGSRIEWWPDTPEEQDTRDFPGIAGWLKDGSLIAYNTRLMPDKSSRTRFVRIVPGQKETLIWEGGLWPYQVNMQMLRDSITLIPRRNSLIAPVWQGPVPGDMWRPNTVSLQEISIETGWMDVITEAPMSPIGSDRETRILCWSTMDTDADGLHTVLNVMEIDTRVIRTIRASHLYQPALSPDGQWVAARRIGDNDPEQGRLILVNLDTGVERMLDQTVAETLWLDDGGLAVISSEKNELGIVDPVTGDYEWVRVLKGGGR